MQNEEHRTNQEEYSYEEGPSIPPASFSKEQKIAVGVLAIFGFLVIVMWMIQFKNSINAPLNRSSNHQSSETCPNGNCEPTEDDLKNKDTDKDSLSDWDELYVYGTSPYLEDSDSDGFSDKNEIDSGNDPNCPIGRDCSSVLLNGQTESDQNLTPNLFDSLGGLGGESGLGEAEQQEIADILAAEMDAAALRELMLAQGMDEELLNKISDEELMKSFQEILSSQ